MSLKLRGGEREREARASRLAIAIAAERAHVAVWRRLECACAVEDTARSRKQSQLKSHHHEATRKTHLTPLRTAASLTACTLRCSAQLQPQLAHEGIAAPVDAGCGEGGSMPSASALLRSAVNSAANSRMAASMAMARVRTAAGSCGVVAGLISGVAGKPATRPSADEASECVLAVELGRGREPGRAREWGGARSESWPRSCVACLPSD